MAAPSASSPWHVILVEDDQDLRETTKRRISALTLAGGNGFYCSAFGLFDEALRTVPGSRPDFLILDIFDGPPAPGNDTPGLEILDRVKATTFVPVILYSAAPDLITGARNPFVRIVEKGTTGFDGLVREITQFLDWRIPQLNRSVRSAFDDTLKGYLWGTVQENWEVFKPLLTQHDFARLVVHRLGEAFAGEAVEKVMAETYGATLPEFPTDTVHASSYYVLPAEGATPRLGEIRVRQAGGGAVELIVVIQPTCDMVVQSGNSEAYVEEVLCLRTVRTGSRTSRSLHQYYLPPFLTVPELWIEFRKPLLIPLRELRGMALVARIASPFCESMAAQFAAHIGRIGTPELRG